MEYLILIMSVCSFLPSLFWLVGTVNGTKSVLVVLLIKMIALLGTITPVIYWFKLLNLI
jgi:hypothetical protein